LFYFAPRHLLPAPVRNFPETIARLHLQLVGRSQNLSSLNSAAKRRCINCDNFLVTQTFRQAPRLPAAFIGKGDIGSAGKPVLGAHDRGAMPDHENSRCSRRHTVRFS